MKDRKLRLNDEMVPLARGLSVLEQKVIKTLTEHAKALQILGASPSVYSFRSLLELQK